MSEVSLRWHVYARPEELVQAAARGIEREAGRAIAATDRFLMVLAGGSTPRLLYSRLAELDAQWDRWHMYFGDERCLPIGHPERNETMARETWLDSVPIPVGQIHPIAAELGPDAGAAAYARELIGVGPFDLTLLGLGEDGHTASLFPGHPAGAEPGGPDVLAVHTAPEPHSSRVSLSAQRLGRSRSVLLIAVGKTKRLALARLRHGADLPIRCIKPANGIDVLIDHEAAPRRPAGRTEARWELA